MTKPSDSEYTELASPPSPFVGFWLSKDEALGLGVVEVDIPRQVKLNQASAEEGLAEEVGGPVTRLPTRKVGGLEVWSMAAKGADLETTQAMLRNEGKLHKLVAMTTGAEPDTETITAFFRWSSRLRLLPKTPRNHLGRAAWTCTTSQKKLAASPFWQSSHY